MVGFSIGGDRGERWLRLCLFVGIVLAVGAASTLVLATPAAAASSCDDFESWSVESESSDSVVNTGLVANVEATAGTTYRIYEEDDGYWSSFKQVGILTMDSSGEGEVFIDRSTLQERSNIDGAVDLHVGYQTWVGEQMCSEEMEEGTNFTIGPDTVHVLYNVPDSATNGESTTVTVGGWSTRSSFSMSIMESDAVFDDEYTSRTVYPDQTSRGFFSADITITPSRHADLGAAEIYSSGGGVNNLGGTYSVDIVEVDDPPTAAFSFETQHPNPGSQIDVDASASTDDNGIDQYRWDVNNDGTFGDPWSVPTGWVRAADEGGNQQVTLEVEDTSSQTDTVTETISVNHLPVADFDVSPTNPTVPIGGSTTVTVDGLPSHDNYDDNDGYIPGSNYDWTVWAPDGDKRVEFSGDSGPIDVNGLSAGTWEVELTVEDNHGGTDTYTRSITVTEEDRTDPTAETGNDRTVTVSGSADFDGSGSSDNVGVTSYEWDVDGDGSYEQSGSSIQQSYQSPGTYSVRLRVKDAAGNAGTDTVQISVEDRTDPSADAGSDQSVNLGDSVNLDGSDSTDNWGIASYDRDLDGDGSYERSGSSISHTYESAGSYDVTLRVSDAAGNTATDTATITVNDPGSGNSPPSASAGPNRTVDAGASVTLDGSGSSDPDSDTLSYQWTQTAGPSVTLDSSTTVSPTFTAPDVASRTTLEFQLSVDDGSATATDVVTVTVVEPSAPEPPIPNASYTPTSPTVGEQIRFDASGSVAPNGTIESYEWDFDGDGSTDATGETATANFSTAGTHDVSLQVTDDNGTTNATTVSVEVITPSPDEPPTANVTYSPKQPVVGEWVEFDASGSVDTNGTIDHYQWEIDGNRTPTSTNPLIGANFSEPGTYHVMVIVTDDDGLTDTASVNVTVEGVAAPTANATATPSTVNVSEPVTLDASASTAPDGAIVAYDWDLDGDGAAETTGETTTVSFSTTGTQEVTLEVTDDNGNNASTTLEVRVVDPNQAGVPVADAGADLNATAGDEVSLDGSGSYHTGGESITYEWTQVAGPSVTLSANGSATPTFTAPSVDQETSMAFDLTVSDASGNTSTDAVSVVVAPADDGGGGDGGGSSGGGDDGSSGGGGGWVPTESDVQVTVDSTPTGPVTVGESFVIDATLENRGDADAQQTIQFGIDGTVVDFTTREIASGETAEVSFEYVVSSAAAADLNVTVRSADDVAAVDVAVSSEDGGTDGDGTSGGSDDGGDSSDGGDGDSTGTEGTAGEDGTAQGGSGAEAPAEDTSGGDGGSQQRVADGGDSDGSGDGGLPGFGIAVGLGVLLTAGVGAVRYWG